jgi:hypothetical protein
MVPIKIYGLLAVVQVPETSPLTLVWANVQRWIKDKRRHDNTLVEVRVIVYGTGVEKDKVVRNRLAYSTDSVLLILQLVSQLQGVFLLASCIR